MSFFEIVMLLCFGSAWPFSIYRSWVSRTSRGKSVVFLFVIFTGYFSGILHKVFYSPDPVTALYVINFLMIGADIMLYCRNRKLDSLLSGKV